MKFKLFDRILLTLFTLVGLVLSVAEIGICIGFWHLEIVAQWLAMQNIVVRAALGLIGLFGIFACIKLLFSHPKTLPVPTTALIKDTANGAIRISIPALTAMARRAALQVEGIREMRCTVVAGSEAIHIVFHVVLMPDVVAPQLMETLQAEVKQYVQAHSGIAVQSVRVSVEDALPGAQ